MLELASGYTQNVLEGPEFESMYGAKVCLCPVITQNQTEETKERIRKCQARHRITIYNLTNSTKLGSKVFGLDSRSKLVGLTLCQMITEQKGSEGKCLFVSVGRSVYENEMIFTYPKLYETGVHTRMAAIGQYLEQQYGIGVRQFFTPEERERMKLTKWDENGNPIFAEDQMVDQVLEECEME
eukprot:14280869-Ditylum_brightwellii.AAC.1